jgi:Putative zinc ribbon domain
MGPKIFCESCTMPIDNIEDRGTENDGARSELYCKYCYQDGQFINPHMTLQQMKDLVIMEMRKLSLPENIIQQTLTKLPYLKRWQRPVPEHIW